MAGIVGVYSKQDATKKALYALYNTQHRGQENAGISAAGNHSLRTYKGKRLISSVFHEDVSKAFIHPTDYIAIGHVGNKKVERKDIAPLELNNNDYAISIALDGKILNHSEVDKEFGLQTTSDEELFGSIFGRYLEESGDSVYAVSKAMKDLEKAYYSLVMAVWRKDKSELIALRDKRGIKPMYMGKNSNTLAVASESGAIENLQLLEEDKLEMRDVRPGELLTAERGGSYEKQILEPGPRHCAFEWVYTARPDAVIERINAHEVRKRLGGSLVKSHNIVDDENTVIIGIPDSGRSVSLGLAEATGIPFDEGLIKNQYIGRTYIISDPDERYKAAMLKHNPLKTVIKDKKVIIGDDSIVRGTISEAIARTLKVAGAKKVELAISYAPIFKPCFDDEPNKKLAAVGLEGKDIYEIGKEVAKKLPTIEKVMYNSVENVVDAIGLPRKKLCTYCITGEKPFE